MRWQFLANENPPSSFLIIPIASIFHPLQLHFLPTIPSSVLIESLVYSTSPSIANHLKESNIRWSSWRTLILTGSAMRPKMRKLQLDQKYWFEGKWPSHATVPIGWHSSLGRPSTIGIDNTGKSAMDSKIWFSFTNAKKILCLAVQTLPLYIGYNRACFSPASEQINDHPAPQRTVHSIIDENKTKQNKTILWPFTPTDTYSFTPNPIQSIPFSSTGSTKRNQKQTSKPESTKRSPTKTGDPPPR
jgi:hypothetical protein